MNVINSVKNYFSRQEPVDYFCQTCGDKLTGDEAMVSALGNVYCLGRGYERAPCLFRSNENVNMFIMDATEPKQIQKGIRKGKITGFSELEKKVSE